MAMSKIKNSAQYQKDKCQNNPYEIKHNRRHVPNLSLDVQQQERTHAGSSNSVAVNGAGDQ